MLSKKLKEFEEGKKKLSEKREAEKMKRVLEEDGRKK